jgi:branched-chain amino acid transport system permease protein
MPVRVAVAALIGVAALVPTLTDDSYLIGVLILACIYAVLAQCWNLVMGVAGIWWFAQLAVFAVGAYANVLLMVKLDVPSAVAMIGGAVAGLLVGLVIGLPAVRLRGIYVVLFTLAFHETMRIVISADDSGFTGGTFGLYGFDAFGLGTHRPDTKVTVYYYGALAMLILTSLAIYRVVHSPVGLAFRTLRESEPYATARGVNRGRYQVAVFGISSLLTGLAGAFYADYFGAISPTVLSFDQVALLLAMIVIGGWGTFSGPIIGAIVVTIVSEQLRDAESVRLLVFALWMAVMIVYVPGGLVGLKRVGGWARARLNRWLED